MSSSDGVAKSSRESKAQQTQARKIKTKGKPSVEIATQVTKTEPSQAPGVSQQMLNAQVVLMLIMAFSTEAFKRGDVSMYAVEKLYHLSDMQKQLFGPLLQKICEVINRQMADSVLNDSCRKDTIIKLNMLMYITLFLFRWDGLIESEKQLSIKLAEKILETYETCSNSSVKQDILGIAGELPETPVSPQMLNMHLVQLLVLAFAGDAMKNRTVTRLGLAKLFNLVEGKHPEVDEIVSALHNKINLIIGADGPETGLGIKKDLVIRLTLMIYTTLFLFRWEMTNRIEQARSLKIAKIIIDTV